MVKKNKTKTLWKVAEVNFPTWIITDHYVHFIEKTFELATCCRTSVSTGAAAFTLLASVIRSEFEALGGACMMLTAA